jgi:plasmid stabilization system protein ParE
VTFKVRFTEEAQADLERLYAFIIERDAGDWTVAELALEAIRSGITLLELTPFSCRKATAGNSFLRELIIAFGATGYVALFEIEDAATVTVLAVDLVRSFSQTFMPRSVLQSRRHHSPRYRGGGTCNCARGIGVDLPCVALRLET